MGMEQIKIELIDHMGKFVPKGKVLKPVTCFEPDLEQFL